jgi:hypothetical protein
MTVSNICRSADLCVLLRWPWGNRRAAGRQLPEAMTSATGDGVPSARLAVLHWLAMAPSAAGMLVIMDRGFPGVALWKAYTQAGAHLLIRARSSVTRRPVQVLADGTYLARMNLPGRRARTPAGSWSAIPS